MAALGLHCRAQAFSSCGAWGLLFLAAHRLLIAVASLVVTCKLRSTGSVVVVHGLSCLSACGIFPGQGSHLCSLRWWVDS